MLEKISKYNLIIHFLIKTTKKRVNEEKMVRGHLKTLASKLIEEVDTLRSQTTAVSTSLNSQTNPTTAAQISLSSAGVVNGSNGTVIRNFTLFNFF